MDRSGPRCPKCQGALAGELRKGIPVGACQGCEGIWLSSQALETLLSRRGATEARATVQQLARIFHKPSEHPCVGCHQPLMTSWIVQVEIEHCPRCKGLFLDKGELMRISKRDETPAQYAGGGGMDLADVVDGGGQVALELGGELLGGLLELFLD